jgi:hypothetical protein
MRYKTLAIGTIIGIAALGLPNGSAQIHPDLKSGEKAIRTILILPPEVKVTKSGVKGAEALVDESRTVEDALPRLVVKALEDKGFQAPANPFSPEALEKNSDLRYALADIQGRFNSLNEQLSKKSKDVEKGRFTMGEEVLKLNPDGSADALIFIRGEGQISTGGKKAFSALGGISGMLASANRIELSITVVDARTGVVLYYGKAGARTDFVKQPEQLSEAIEKALKNFTCPPPVKIS